MPASAGKELKMDTYNQDDYDFIEDSNFQLFLNSRLNGKFVPYAKFMRILNKCKEEYIYYLNNKDMFVNKPLF